MSDNSTTNLWLFLEMIARRRGLIFSLVILATLAAVVISLLLPKWYTSTALLMPPPDESVRGGLSQLTEIRQFTGGARIPGLVTPNDVYAKMLASRRVSDKIIKQFNLMEQYQTSNLTATYLILSQRTQISVSDEGLMKIGVEDRDPEMAAAMATAYVEQLIDLNRELLSSSAREKREFIEARLGEVRTQLDASRRTLETFQIENRTVNLDEQARMVLTQAVDLKVTRASLALEIKMKEKVLGTAHPDLEEKNRRLGLIDDQLAALEWGGAGDSSFFSVPISAVPGLRGEYESLFASVRVNESLHETLLELYEQARIQEQEKTPTIAVLDWPTVPDLRSRPQRSLIVMATFMISLMVSLFIAGWLEFVRRMSENQPDDYRRLMMFTDAFLGWLPGVRKHRS
jgi:uncharacterized protein involved in exopolysaccharide biosynthesis